jgi:hypothetical protein
MSAKKIEYELASEWGFHYNGKHSHHKKLKVKFSRASRRKVKLNINQALSTNTINPEKL